MRKWLPNILVAAVGALFCASAVLKLISIEAFELYIFGFGVLGWDLSAVAARLIVSAEFVLALAYLTGVGYGFFRWAGIVALAVFTLFLIPVSIIRPDGNCHCFGETIDIKPLPSIIKNIVLLAPLVFIRRLSSPLDRLSANWTVAIAVAVSVGVIINVFAISPPDFFFIRKDVPLDREAFYEYIGSDTEEEPELVCFYSTFCGHCRIFSRKVTAMCKKYGVPQERVRIVLMDLGEETSSEAWEFLKESGLSASTGYTLLDPPTLLTITCGQIPCAVLVAGGEIKGAYNYTNFDKNVVNTLDYE